MTDNELNELEYTATNDPSTDLHALVARLLAECRRRGAHMDAMRDINQEQREIINRLIDESLQNERELELLRPAGRACTKASWLSVHTAFDDIHAAGAALIEAGWTGEDAG